jgi:acyl-CoA synthetase (NDP forming)
MSAALRRRMDSPVATPPLAGLSALFTPTSVAIVGASDDRERLSGRPVRYLLEAGYRGRILPVNPKREYVQGLAAYPSIESLPETPDVALIVVAASAVKEAVLACARRGVRGVYLLSGGFAESGEAGERSQREIQSIARNSGMRLLGPNCLGAFNAETRFYGTFATSLERGFPESGPVAIVSQSGAYGQHLAYLVRKRGLGVKYLITTGNEIDVELGECIAWLAEQPEIGVILAYAEGIRDGARLMQALEAARRACKPVVFTKVGSSDAGARAAISHTAAMAGADTVYDAVLRQFGAHRATSTEEQVDVAYACARARPLVGRRTAIVSVSGGFGVQTADAAELAGLDVAPLSDALRGQLRAVLPMGGCNNPIDVTGQAVNDLKMLSGALGIVADQGGYDALFVCLTTVPLANAIEAPMRRALAISTAPYRHQHPVVLLTAADESTVRAYEAEGFLVYEDAARAAKAIGALARFGLAFARENAETQAVPLPRASIPSGTLSEVDAKRLLRSIGVPMLPEVLATSAQEAVAAAASVGSAVALKIVSPEIVHKTDIGGVLLGVSGPEAVRNGFETLIERAQRAMPGVRIDGVLVSPMAPKGVETILGVARDPTFGPVVMFGLGGIFAECFKDASFRVAPISAAEAHRMVDDTRAAAVLRGWRGAKAADVASVVDTLVALSRFAVANADTIDTIDINPFLVLPEHEGAVALDAMVVTRQP